MADVVAGSRAVVAWFGTIGRPVATRALPTWAGVAIVAGVVMGGNGLGPGDVVRLAGASGRALAVLAIVWLLLSSAAVRVTRGAPGAAYLRSLPGGPGLEALTVGALAALVHLPWAALWLAGGGAVRGALAWLAMTAASLALVAAAGRWRRALPTPAWAGPRAALVGVHVRALARRRASALAVGAGMAALGGALGALMIGHEARDAGDATLLAGAAAALALAGALVAATAAVADSDRQLGWLAVAAGVPAAARRAATAIVLGALGLAAGAVATLATLAVRPPDGAQLAAVAGTHALLGLGLGLGAVEVAARARRDGRVDGGRVVVGQLGLGVGALLAIGVFHAVGVAAVVVVGAGLAAGGRAP